MSQTQLSGAGRQCDMFLLNKQCSCALCLEDPLHTKRLLHDLLSRLTNIVDSETIGDILAALSASSFWNDQDEILVQIGNTSISEFRKFKDNHLSKVRDGEIRVETLRRNPAIFAGDSYTIDVLKCVSQYWWLPVQEHVPIRIVMNGHVNVIFLPSKLGGWALQEILFGESYAHEPAPVNHIYDLGAFIGLSALYLKSIYPAASLTCVEPSPANLGFLKKNLRANFAAFTILPVAVDATVSTVELAASSQPSMTDSAVFSSGETQSLSVPSMSLSDIVSTGNYGIKMDIEGAEFSLKSCSDVLKNARWIMGELHYGEFSKLGDDWLTDLLRTHFSLTLAPVKIDRYGSTYIFAQNFCAIRK